MLTSRRTPLLNALALALLSASTLLTASTLLAAPARADEADVHYRMALEHKRAGHLPDALREARDANLSPQPYSGGGVWKGYLGGPDADVPEPETRITKKKALEDLVRFFSRNGTGYSAAHYERWAKKNAAASQGTVRNIFGSWSEAKLQALRHAD